MLDLLFDTIDLLRDYVRGGIAVVVAILILTLGFLAKIIHTSCTSDLTRDELRLLKAFNEQAKENQSSRDLSVEFAAYKAELDKYEDRLQRLKALGYLQDSTSIKGGYLGHRRVRITAKGVQRAEKKR